MAIAADNVFMSVAAILISSPMEASQAPAAAPPAPPQPKPAKQASTFGSRPASLSDEQVAARKKLLKGPWLRQMNPGDRRALTELAQPGSQVDPTALLELVQGRGLYPLSPARRQVVLAQLKSHPRSIHNLVQLFRGPSFGALEDPVKDKALQCSLYPDAAAAVRCPGFRSLGREDQLALLDRIGNASHSPLSQLPVDRADRARAGFLMAWASEDRRPTPDESEKISGLLTRLAHGETLPGAREGLPMTIAGSRAYLGLPPAQVDKLLKIAHLLVPPNPPQAGPALATEFRTAFYELATAQAAAPLLSSATGQNSKLLSRDFKGGTLLDNLHALATEPLAPEAEAAGVTRSGLLHHVMRETGVYGGVKQGQQGSCTTSGITGDLLAKNAPAEYARLVAGLVGSSKSVRIANNDRIAAVPDAFPNDNSRRSPSERIVQAALMNYGLDGLHRYSNRLDKRVSVFGSRFGTGEGGLYSIEVHKVLQGVFGRPFQLQQIWEAPSSPILAGVMASPSPGTPDVMRRTPTELVETLRQRSGHDTAAGLAWRDAGHFIVVETVQNGRVYFRNPQRSQEPAGTELLSPPRRIEDPSRGLESMTMEEFTSRVTSLYVPK